MEAIRFVKLQDDAFTPTYAREGDAGADLYAVHGTFVPPKGRVLIQTGLAIEIPYGYVGLVHPRSGLASKKGITVLNAPGTVDAGYRGEVMVNLYNTTDKSVPIEYGERVAQIIFQKVELAVFEEVEQLSDSVRGTGGYGSTG